jgi:hypothetical protein
MTALTILLACVAVIAAIVAVVALVALRRARGAATREAAMLRERVDAMEAQLRTHAAASTARAARAEQEYVITRLGELEPVRDEAPVPVSLTTPAFADAVLRETVVQTAALVQGVRRALAPETRNRIRFEMKRELKRARKSRKVEVKEALREYRARHRAETPDPPSVVGVAGVARVAGATGSEGAA